MPAPEETQSKVSTPSNFFEGIGSKVDKVNGTEAATAEDGGAGDRVVEEIESLCMNCGENGTTRLLLTSIPYFRDVIIMSFYCDKCGFRNNEVQPAGSTQPKGVYYELRLTEMADFARQVIKSDSATVKFIELDLEVPPGRGQLTNVEGLLSTIVDDLASGQEARKEQAPEVFEKLAEIIVKGRAMLEGSGFPFRLVVDDPAGNSFISPDLKDGVGKWEKREYLRTPEQNEALGLSATDAGSAEKHQAALTAEGDIIPNEVYSFPATCPGCMHACTTHMKMVDIPHFKQVVLMSTVCQDCGYRSNDVKTGGAIPDKGERIKLSVKDSRDLGRDILKSESCSLECPELNLMVNPGTLGGRFTTVEGLFTQVRNDLHNQIFHTDESGAGGDSLPVEEKTKWTEFFESLDAAIRGEKQFTVVLTDPMASSYVQPLTEPPAPDPQITREQYERTDEEEEELGLKDIKVDGYDEQSKQEPKASEEVSKDEKKDETAES